MFVGGLLTLIAYLIGSVPFGLVITKLAGLGDIRDIGSGNIGATNVLRTGRKDLALATLILDAGKGGAMVLLVWWLTSSQAWGLAAGLAAFLGHLYPLYLGFKGGKGVATGLGTLLAGVFWLGLVACALWLAMAALMRYSSLSALTAFAGSALAAWIFWPWWVGLWLTMMAVLVIYKHQANIKRLLSGEEPKIGGKKS